jgi:hypothetical protein
LKLQIVENKTGKVASPIKCFIRNIFIIIWPIEVIVTLINPSRRIGDLVAGTKVVPFKPDHEQLKINFVQIGLSFVLAYSLLLIVMLPLKVMKSKMESQRINYVESSLNEIAAAETEKLFSDSLSSYLNADVRIYDQIQEYSDLKYISVIIRLKENYLESDHDYEHIKSLTMPLLLSKFPKGTFTGQMKFVYQQPGSMQTRTLQLDWREIE